MRSKPTAPRVSVKGAPGVFFRERADGTRKYCFTYRDSDGKQRWESVEGGERDAKRALRTKLARLDAGERVRPSRKLLREFGDEWLDSRRQLRASTRSLYRTHLRVHLYPRLGSRRLDSIREEDVSRLIGDMQAAGAGPWTIRTTVGVLGRILDMAKRRGHVAINVVRNLDSGERPKLPPTPMRVLTTEEITAMLAAADDVHYPLLAVAVFTGMRQGELLGLTWADVDLPGRMIRVVKQLDRSGQRVEPKTPNAVREIPIMDSLVALLREHKVASPFKQPGDFVFCSGIGTPLHFRNVARRGLEPALAKAGISTDGEGERVRFHDLRHSHAAILISQGHDIAYISKRLGHSKISTTLDVYGHVFDQHRHADRVRERMEAEFGSALAPGCRETNREQDREAMAFGGEVLRISA